MKQIRFLFMTLTLVTLMISCKKDDTKPTDPPRVTTGIYILNEGSFGGNNTSLTYYDFQSQTATTDYYKNVNGSGLGDTGNDMIIYGSKLYIVMNVSSYLEVADARTAESIKKIDLKNSSSQPLSPRNVVACKNNVFVSCWDGTVAVIDTSSLQITKFVTVGANPEQMVIAGNNLYVTNSGGITPGFDSTVSVVDLNTLTETKKITVGTNPNVITADDAGNLYVGYVGDYGSKVPGLVKVSIASGMVTKAADTAVGKIKFYNGKLYATGGFFGSQNVRVLNTTDFSSEKDNFITDGTIVKIAYALNIDESNGDVYVGDMVDYVSPGSIFCFDKDGRKKFSASVSPGIGPNTVAFIRQ